MLVVFGVFLLLGLYYPGEEEILHPTAGPPAECSQQDLTPLSAALFPQPRWRTGSTGEALPQPRGSRQQPLVPNEWDLHCAGAGGNSLICNLCACHMSLQRQVLTAGSKRWGLAGRTKRNRLERVPSTSAWVDKTSPFPPLPGQGERSSPDSAGQ